MQNNNDQEIEDKPPVFPSWKGWYWLLIIALVGWILFLYLFTAYYS